MVKGAFYMNARPLTENEMVAYKLFVSGKAKLELPGGYKFEWSA